MVNNGATALVRALAAEGVKYLFTLSGNQILSIYDACLDHDVELIHVRHEATATFMADAWGRLTEKPGVALVAAGPGHTNALTPLYVAGAAESPLVLLSGHCRSADMGRGAFQEMDQVGLARPVTKASWLALDPQRLGHDILRAFRMAETGRPGPVHISLPSDVLEAQVEDAAEGIPPPEAFEPVSSPVSKGHIEQALDLLVQAHHPLILVGPSMARPKRWAEVAKLIEVTHIPALRMESPRGMRDPQLGEAAGIFPEADVVLLLGKRLDFTLQFGDVFASTCRIIQVDPPPRKDNKRGILLIAGDPATVARQLSQGAKHHSWPDTTIWADEIDQARHRGKEEWALWEQSIQAPTHPLRLCRELRFLFKEHTVLVSDGGEFGQWAQAALSAKHRLINGPSGNVGGAIPMALAAKLARPDALVVALLGDGAFGFHALEFDTAVRYSVPILAIVGNDAAWNAEKQIQIRRYGMERAVGCDLSPTRYDKLVEALGGHGEYVEHPGELAPALERAIQSGKPACVNVAIEGCPAP